MKIRGKYLFWGENENKSGKYGIKVWFVVDVQVESRYTCKNPSVPRKNW
jgi:hypothetical protein